MPTVVDLTFPVGPPVVGRELRPYIILSSSENSYIDEDVPEAGPIDGQFIRYSWYRWESKNQGSLCFHHPSEPAKLQCQYCLKLDVPVSNSFHCSDECFLDGWPRHRASHESTRPALRPPASTPLSSAVVPQIIDVKNWLEVARSKTYIPTAADVGRCLKFEFTLNYAESKLPTGIVKSGCTLPVIPAPASPPRRMAPVDQADPTGPFGSFSVLSYSNLADGSAGSKTYCFCPPWALDWSNRRKILLREILSLSADIVCLPEVQTAQCHEFFFTELTKHGYQASNMIKTQKLQVLNEKKQIKGGCVTFFLADRFTFVSQCEMEFKKELKILMDGLFPTHEDMFDQLDDVALILVLESKFSNWGGNKQGKSRYLCVVNTRIHKCRYLKYTKLLQVHILLKVLKNLGDRKDVAIIICGDLSAIFGSLAYQLITLEKNNQKHPDFDLPADLVVCHLVHQLQLISACSSGGDLSIGLRWRRSNQQTDRRPLLNITGRFRGTLDYIFYRGRSLKVQSLWGMIDESNWWRNTHVPCPSWASHYPALLARFQYVCETKEDIAKPASSKDDQGRCS